jgi:GT2 family glycosyltransferase
MAPKVYCIIINWNGDSDTIRCLNSLLRLDYDNCHVVLSDNGSRTESLRVLKDWKAIHLATGQCGGISSLQIFENGRNLGFTGANTVGINHALANEADYVLFLNNDTIVTPDFLSRMVAAAEADPSVGITGCKIFLADHDQQGRHQIWSLGGYSFVAGMPINIGAGQYDEPAWTGCRTQPLINGCCMLIKRAVIETIGVQDDRLFFGMDDVEYSLRASRGGWKNLVVYDAVIYHASAQSVVPRSGLQAYYIFRNALQLRVHHFRWYQNLVFFTVFISRYIAAGSIYRWLTGDGKVNRGIYYAIRDFISGNTGECKHAVALRGS